MGMTEEETLKALGLEEKDVTVEEEEIPAENVLAPKRLRTMNGPDMTYQDVTIRLRLTFLKFVGRGKHGSMEPVWEGCRIK